MKAWTGVIVVLLLVAGMAGFFGIVLFTFSGQTEKAINRAPIMLKGAIVDAEREAQYEEMHEQNPRLYPR